jgi:hypothetical protein
MLKRCAALAVLTLLALPGWGASAQKMTVAQLKDLLASEHQAKMTDAEVSAGLQNVELTEQLSHSTMLSLAPEVPGKLTTEQLFVLEIRSAVLPPPAADLPQDAAPDAATQQALLKKAEDYAANTYAQLPSLTATKTVRRFQDDMKKAEESVGARNNANFAPEVTPIHYAASVQEQVILHNGVEQISAEESKPAWGRNGMIALLGQAPTPTTVMSEAQASGKIGWLRWDQVDGKKVAVYSFTIDKKKSHYALDYCCFPQMSQAGEMTLRGQESGGGPGNYMNSDTWKPWKATVPYHGEIFVDPASGAVVRLVTQANLKGSDPVRVEDRRIDYAEQKVGDLSVMVPVQTEIDTLEQPFPDLAEGRFVMRHTLFLSEYTDYKKE